MPEKFRRTLKAIRRIAGPALIAGSVLAAGAVHAQERELTPKENEITSLILETGKKHGLSDRGTWQLLNYDTTEIKNNIKDSTTPNPDWWKKALDLHRDLKKQGILDSIGRSIHLIPETQRDSIEAWRREYQQKTRDTLGPELLKKLLRSTRQNLQQEIRELQQPKSDPLNPTVDSARAKADSLKANIFKRAIRNGIYDRYFETPEKDAYRLFRFYLNQKGLTPQKRILQEPKTTPRIRNQTRI